MRSLLLSVVLVVAVAGAAMARAEVVCTLIADAATGAVLREQGDCTTRVTPASTFKLALAVMGFDAGVLTDARSPVMAFRAGDPDWGGADWRRDTDPTAWMRHSVVWYSQRITAALGARVLTRYAKAFGYGNADVSGDPGFDNGLERAWIASSLRISPREQARFVRALVLDSLPVSPKAMALARSIVESRHVGGWTIHGKTGSAYPRRADRSFDYARGWGWFIGWATRGDRQLVFVRLTQASAATDGSPGILTRDQFLQDWPALVQDLVEDSGR